MKLSTKARYGVKAVVDLAVAYEAGSGPVSTAALAAQQGISPAYLEQLIASLKKAGLISSARGAQGGHCLSRRPEEISVGEVLEALEGSTALLDCVGYGDAGCEQACTCSARPLWIKLQSRINAVLAETTIRDMAEDYTKQKRRFQDYESIPG